MKIRIYDWAGQTKDKLAPLGLSHNQELEYDEDNIWRVIRKVFDQDLEVMVARSADGSLLLGVDKKGGKFRQR